MTSSQPKRRITIRDLQKMKTRGQRITMLTAYDFPTAQLLDEAGVDVLLVGDSLGMVVQGHSTTIPVTLNHMIYHGEMVTRGSHRAFVLVDLPFPHGQLGVQDTLRAAAKLMKKTGCHGVKLEGGAAQADTIAALVDAGIPVMAHVGLRPQSVHALGGYVVQRNAERVLHDATTAQQAGAFSVLMECVPDAIAAEVTRQLTVPTIGIGAGPHCDGQVLVTNDLLGWNSGYLPKFVRQYAQLRQMAVDAVTQFKNDLQNGDFPGQAETFQE